KGAEAVLALGEVAQAIEDCPVPVIAAVQGPALGGGAELFVACDVAVMQKEARVAFVHVRMGLVPAWGGTTRLVERVGAARAAELLMSARPLGAEEALACGLAARVADSARDEALRLAEAMAQHGREALVRMKRAIL